MKKISAETISKIIDVMDIYEVVSDYVTLKKKGANFWALSPFSKEKSPSFAVNPAKGIFKCFSSGIGGNAITFIMQVEGFSYVEALRALAQKYDIQIDESEQKDNELLKESIRLSLYDACKFFISNRNSVFSDYMKERYITQESIDKFNLGIAKDSWTAYTDTLQDCEIAEQANTVVKSEKNGKFYDVFRNRIMFPIYLPSGSIVGFGGRVIGNSNEAKYVNTRETILYDKGNILYGLHLAKKSIRMNNFAFITEGYMDVVAMHQYGYENTVCTSGTALTERQVRVLRRFTKKVVLIYDGDSAGIKAALRCIDILISEGMEVYVMTLPDGHDPDSYLRILGKDNFDLEIAKKQNFVDFKINMGMQEGMTPKEVRGAIDEIAKSISLINDPIEMQIYARAVSEKTKVDYSLIYAIVNENVAKKEAIQAKLDLSYIDIALSNADSPIADNIEFTEKIILEFYLRYGNEVLNINNEYIVLVDYIESIIQNMTFFNSLYQTIREDFLQNRLGIEGYINHTDDRIKMVATSLNSMEKRISLMLNDLDSFDMQIAWAEMVQQLVTIYQNEWHNKMYKTVLSRITYNQSVEEYLKTVKPILDKINETELCMKEYVIN